MGKDTTFIGQPIFLQVIRLLSRADIRSIELELLEKEQKEMRLIPLLV